MADVVLPAACWEEKEYSFTNSERKVQRVRKAVEPPPDARPDWMILWEIGRRLGIPMNFSSTEDVFNEMAALTPSCHGIRYERIEKRDPQ
jgi:predicted molibdopterin-dependent oxidoreductase YjgC